MNTGLGFTFCGKHSGEFNTIAKSVNRTLLPSKRLQQVTIPGRDGVYDAGKKFYNNRIITMRIGFLGESYTLQKLRELAREIAFWLGGKGKLIFDDEPDKYYIAQVADGVDIEQLGAYGVCDIAFDCEPFAYREQTVELVNDGHNKIDYQGTAKTPTIIVLQNNNRFPISNITITAVKRR